MSATFETYFTLGEIQARLPFSEKSIREKVKRGEFSPPGADGQPDLSNILFDGVFLVPLSGLEHYRVTHAMSVDGLVSSVVSARLRSPAPARPGFSSGIRARSIGEARRKLLQTPGANNGEVTHG
jgi:hypothetical protein